MPLLARLRSTRPAARIAIVALLAVAALAVLAFVDPIPQDPAYHAFADRRGCCAMPNCGDVASNAAFLLVGVVGIRAARRRIAAGVERAAHAIWSAFFVAVCAVAFGSAWYHWSPDTPRLVWDRLPMACGFGFAVAAVWSERVGRRSGAVLAWVLPALGAATVAHWARTEDEGRGDLRWYGFAQFFPSIALPCVFALFPPRFDRTRDYAWCAVWYAAAKALEACDRPVFDATGGVVSGHTLKHVAAAVAVGVLARMVARRAVLPA